MLSGKRELFFVLVIELYCAIEQGVHELFTIFGRERQFLKRARRTLCKLLMGIIVRFGASNIRLRRPYQGDDDAENVIAEGSKA